MSKLTKEQIKTQQLTKEQLDELASCFNDCSGKLIIESDARAIQQLANRSYFFDMLFIACGAALGSLVTYAVMVL